MTRASADSKKPTFPGRGEQTGHPLQPAPHPSSQLGLQCPDLCLWVSSFSEAKPVEMSLIREGGEEEKGIQPKPEQGAASAGEKEEAEEGSYGGPDGPGTPGAMNDENHEASGDSGGEPGEQRQEEQPLQAVAQRRQPWDRQQVVQRPMFTQVQAQELEHIFRHNAYPNLFMR